MGGTREDKVILATFSRYFRGASPNWFMLWLFKKVATELSTVAYGLQIDRNGGKLRC